MNIKVKRTIEFLAIVVITIIVAISSPLNPWANNVFTDVQNEILSIAHSVREGYLAYAELDGHYGPVVYEFYGLGYLPTESHAVQFAMECVVLFFSILFIYKTAKLYTSEVFAFITAAGLTIFEMYIAVASPSTLELVAMISSSTSSLRRTINSLSLIS